MAVKKPFIKIQCSVCKTTNYFTKKSKATAEKKLELKVERVKYWLSVGAQPSSTVHNLLLKNGIISDEKKKRSVFLSKKRKTKIEEAKKKKEAPAA